MTNGREWEPAYGGQTVGMAGPEGGIISRDEVTAGGARITLELGGSGAPFPITASVEGWMVHVRQFANEDEAWRAFDEMKPALAALAEGLPRGGARSVDAAARQAAHRAMTDFMSRFS